LRVCKLILKPCPSSYIVLTFFLNLALSIKELFMHIFIITLFQLNVINTATRLLRKWGIPCKRIELELWLWAIKDSCDCTSSHCPWPLYEVALNSKHPFLSYGPDKEKEQRALTLQILKMQLWLLYTAISLIALDYVWSCIEFQLVVFKWCTRQRSNKGQ
jgi:hypothetical protein